MKDERYYYAVDGTLQRSIKYEDYARLKNQLDLFNESHNRGVEAVYMSSPRRRGPSPGPAPLGAVTGSPGLDQAPLGELSR